MTVSEENLTPGEVLLAAREKAALSLEQVAESTRIAPNMLRAIELDEYHKISGDLYVKSFLRSYAQAVALDPEELIELYQAHTGEPNAEGAGAPLGGWDEQDVKITKVGLPWGWFALIAVVIIGAGFMVYRWTGDEPVESVAENPIADSSGLPATGAEDTLSLGWQLEAGTEASIGELPASPAPEPEKTSLPRAFPGDAGTSFAGGRHWAYVVRLISAEPGVFAIKKDAEASFQASDFSADKGKVVPLPSEEVVAGRAYAVQRGFVVYWGADDHLSLRLGHVNGVEVSFNAEIQDLSRFRDGEEILLDSSRLTAPLGN